MDAHGYLIRESKVETEPEHLGLKIATAS